MHETRNLAMLSLQTNDGFLLRPESAVLIASEDSRVVVERPGDASDLELGFGVVECESWSSLEIGRPVSRDFPAER